MSQIPNIVCPGCTKEFKGKTELIGKTIRCPSCDRQFVYQPKSDESSILGDGLFGFKDEEKIAAEEVAAMLSGRQKPASDSEDQPDRSAEEEKPPIAFADDGDESKPAVSMDEEDDDDPYGVTELDTQARCPHCANPLESETAVVCLTCGYNLVTRKLGRTKTVYANTIGEQLLHLTPAIVCVGLVLAISFANLWFCLVFREDLAATIPFLDHEAVRIWVLILSLLFLWAMSHFAYKRLIVNPVIEEREKRKSRSE